MFDQGYDFALILRKLFPSGSEEILAEDNSALEVIKAVSREFSMIYQLLVDVIKSSCPLVNDALLYPIWQGITKAKSPVDVLAAGGIVEIVNDSEWRVTNTTKHLQSIVGDAVQIKSMPGSNTIEFLGEVSSDTRQQVERITRAHVLTIFNNQREDKDN